MSMAVTNNSTLLTDIAALILLVERVWDLFQLHAVNVACGHSGKVSYEVTKTKLKEGIKESDWCPRSSF